MKVNQKAMFKQGVLWISVLLLSAGCGIINVTKSGSATARFDNYSENLGESRIVFSEIPTVDIAEDNSGPLAPGSGAAVDQDLQQAMSNYSKAKSEEPYFSGFTILVYSGLDRDLAFKTRNDLYSAIPDIRAEMQYQQPRYLVKVGKYINRIEALYLFGKIREKFPTARIIQDRFQRDITVDEQDIQNVEG